MDRLQALLGRARDRWSGDTGGEATPDGTDDGATDRAESADGASFWTDRRKTAVAAVLLLATGATLAATTTFVAEKNTHWQTDSNLTVEQNRTHNFSSGNPFDGTRTLELSGVRFRGQNANISIIGLNVILTNSEYTWTNISVGDATNGYVIVNRSGSKPVGVQGKVDTLSVPSNTNLSEGAENVDLVADAGGSWDLIVNSTNLSQGTSLIAVDDDQQLVYDSATVDSNGSVRFTDMPPVENEEINIRPGVAELKVYQESDPTQLVDNVELRIRFFERGTEQVTERTVTDGTVSLDGIPGDSPVAVTVKDGSDYTFRRITLESTFEQREVYLLNTTKSDVTKSDVVFELDDRTGRYPASSTTLFIKKPINKDWDGDGTNETRYVTIAGDTFGGGGEFPTSLAVENRYRLVVENEQGNRRVIGSYTARGSDRETIRIGRVSVQADGNQGWTVEMETFEEDTDNDGTKEQYGRVKVVGGEERIESVDFSISPRGGTPIINDTATGPIGEYVATYKLNNSIDNTTYVLNWSATRELPNGTDVQYSGQQYAGDVPEVGTLIPLDPKWRSLLGYLAIISMAGLVVTVDATLAGVAAVVTAGLLSITGFVDVPTPAFGLAAGIVVIALFGRVKQ